jgi:hypothetical protein
VPTSRPRAAFRTADAVAVARNGRIGAVSSRRSRDTAGDDEKPAPNALVVPLKLPSRRLRALWLLMRLVLMGGSAVWIALAPSWQAVVDGGLLSVFARLGLAPHVSNKTVDARQALGARRRR